MRGYVGKCKEGGWRSCLVSAGGGWKPPSHVDAVSEGEMRNPGPSGSGIGILGVESCV